MNCGRHSIQVGLFDDLTILAIKIVGKGKRTTIGRGALNAVHHGDTASFQ